MTSFPCNKLNLCFYPGVSSYQREEGKYFRLLKAIVNYPANMCLQALMNHLEDQNVDAFTDTVKEYDSISRLDQWYTTMLLRIKKSIAAEDLC